MEQAFAPDFLFSTIKNVNFGGLWVAVWIDGFGFALNGGQPSVTASVNFPGLAGGTPGLVLDTSYPSAPRAVTAADLSKDGKARAGLKVRFIGASNIHMNGDPNQGVSQPGGVLVASNSIGDITGFNIANYLLFAAPTSSPFEMVLDDISLNNVFQAYGAATLVDASKVKPGLVLPAGVPIPPWPSNKQASYFLSVTNLTPIRFTIDPRKLTVTGGN